jgi:hypothetical protein
MRAVIPLVIGLISVNCFAMKIQGKVATSSACDPKKAMVWLSLDKDNYKERLLLMHTMVPIGGTFEFHVKPGKYQVRASDEKGCEDYKQVEVSSKDVILSLGLGEKK